MRKLYKAKSESHTIYQTYYDKSCYEGRSVNGMRHGQGVYVFPDRSYYRGSWFNNAMNGVGMLYYSNN